MSFYSSMRPGLQTSDGEDKSLGPATTYKFLPTKLGSGLRRPEQC